MEKTWTGEDTSAITIGMEADEIYVSVYNGITGLGSEVVITDDESMEILEHLNRLLGNPLSYGAPVA